MRSDIWYRLAVEKLEQSHREAEMRRLVRLGRQPLKLRVALILQKWAERLEPDLRCPPEASTKRLSHLSQQ